jgi:hypothetical protein
LAASAIFSKCNELAHPTFEVRQSRRFDHLEHVLPTLVGSWAVAGGQYCREATESPQGRQRLQGEFVA